MPPLMARDTNHEACVRHVVDAECVMRQVRPTRARRRARTVSRRVRTGAKRARTDLRRASFLPRRRPRTGLSGYGVVPGRGTAWAYGQYEEIGAEIGASLLRDQFKTGAKAVRIETCTPGDQTRISSSIPIEILRSALIGKRWPSRDVVLVQNVVQGTYGPSAIVTKQGKTRTV